MAFSLRMAAPSGFGGTLTGMPSGTQYTVDAQGEVVVTNVADVSVFYGLGFTPTSPGGKNNYAATTDPAPTNDSSQDYQPGSIWYNTGAGSTGPRLWECVSSTVGAAVWMLKSQATASFRNVLDGGDFTTNPWQRNIPGLASAGVISAAVSNTVTYFADRWFAVGGASSSILMAKVADTSVAGFANCLKFSRSSGNSNTAVLNFGQVMETSDSVRLAGQQVTFSFWAKSGANYSGGALTVQVFTGTGTNDTAANMVAGSWATSATPVNATQALSATMTRYQFTGTIPAGTTQIGVLLAWTPAGTAGADDSISYHGLQLEIGATAGPFEHRDIQVETEIAQRYAWVIAEPASGVVVGMGACPTTTTATIYMATPVQMLKAPTLSVTTGTFNFRPANAAASGTAAAGGTHTVNAITIAGSGITATTAGFATPLLGGGGSGFIVASADF